MAFLNSTIGFQPEIAAGGGDPTRYVYSGTAANTWITGELLTLSSGTVIELVSSGGAGTAGDIGATEFGSAAGQLFIALEDVATATTGNVAVQRVTADTLFRGIAIDGSTLTTAPTLTDANIGVNYELYKCADGTWAVNVDNTSSPCVEIVNIENNLWQANSPDYPVVYDSNSNKINYPIVTFRFLNALVVAQ